MIIRLQQTEGYRSPATDGLGPSEQRRKMSATEEGTRVGLPFQDVASNSFKRLAADDHIDAVGPGVDR